MDIRKTLFKVIGIIIFIAIAIFSYYQYRFYINGPKIIDINLQKDMEVTEPSIIVKATLSNTKSVTINDKDIPIINRKEIEEPIVFSPGDNIINISLKDNFDNIKLYSYKIYYLTNPVEYKTLKEVKSDEKTKEEDLIINNN